MSGCTLGCSAMRLDEALKVMRRHLRKGGWMLKLIRECQYTDSSNSREKYIQWAWG